MLLIEIEFTLINNNIICLNENKIIYGFSIEYLIRKLY